jgi:large subunit ribosomal protein L17
MKHKIGFNRLSRKSSHRKALIRNMVGSLFIYERIKTTKSKAKEVRKAAEKMITKAKIDSVHTRREIAKKLYKKSIISKLFTEIAPRFISRFGGYTRVIKLGQRPGDASEMVFLELVDRKEKEQKKQGKDKKETKTDIIDKKETKTEVKTVKKTTKKPVKKEVKDKIEKKETVKETKKEDKDITLMKEPEKASKKEDKKEDKDTTIMRE